MRLSKLQIQEVVQDYLNGQSITEIANKFNISTPSVCYHMDKFPEIIRNTFFTSKRKYTLNEYYFENIDTEHKAYWLGFLYADGCNNTKRHVVKIALQERDGYILKDLIKEIEYTKPLSFSKKLKSSHQNQLSLTITDKRTSLFLEKQGMTRNKTHILTFPKNLKEELIIHFIRGVFDGDGYVSNFKEGVRNNTCVFSITGTYDICYNVGKYFEKIIGTSYSIKTNRNSFVLSIGGRLQLAKVHKCLYNNSTIFLKRKKERFEKWEKYERIPTMKNNIKRIIAAKKNGIKYKKPILQYSLKGELIKEWDGIVDIAKYFNDPTLIYKISKCARNKQKTTNGFIWKFK